MKFFFVFVIALLSIAACNTSPDITIPRNNPADGKVALTDNAEEIVLDGVVEDTALLYNSGGEEVIHSERNIRSTAVMSVNQTRKAAVSKSTKDKQPVSSTAGDVNGGAVESKSPTTAQPDEEAVAATETGVATGKKKEGWSNTAKGTAIGAGTGAVAGAIISRKKGKGALIGGIVGAGAGYVIGKRKDKKADTTTHQ